MAVGKLVGVGFGVGIGVNQVEGMNRSRWLSIGSGICTLHWCRRRRRKMADIRRDFAQLLLPQEGSKN